MLRKNAQIWMGVALFAIAAPGAAQQAELSEEDLGFAETVEAYQTQLTLGSDPDAHGQAVRDVLGEFDGRIIIEGFFSGEFCVMIWDAGIENVIVFRNDEEAPLDLYTDELGRPAFAAAGSEYDLSGWIDVRQGRLHLAVTMDGVAMRWVDDLPTLPDDAGGAMMTTTERVCKCGPGGISLCPDDDCESPTTCTQPNGNQANCVWQAYVKDEPANPHEFCMSTRADGIFGLGILAGLTFCPPVRRRLIRRIRRGS